MPLKKTFFMELTNVDNVIADMRKKNDIAVTRTLNILTKRALRALAKEINKQYTIKQNAVIKATKVTKATKHNKRVGWLTRGSRVNWIRPKKLSRGVSHIGLDRKRRRVTTNIKGGSKPFLIPVRAGGSGGDKILDKAGNQKMVAGYRRKGMKKEFTTFKGHSIPHMMERIGVTEEFLDAYIEKHFATEYNKQLKRAGFR
jgi:hypothetical protein